MKLFYIIVKDIRACIRNNGILLLVIICGMAAALATHLISFCVIQYETNEKSKYSVYNTFTFPAVDCDHAFRYQTISRNEDVVNAFLFFIPEDTDYVLVGWYGDEPANWFPLGEGTFLTRNQDPMSAFVSDSIAVYHPNEHDSITIAGLAYEIVGSTKLDIRNLLNGLGGSIVSSFCNYEKIIFIPMEQILSMGYRNAFLRVQMNHIAMANTNEMERFVNSLLDETGCSEVLYPPDPLQDFLIRNSFYFLAIGALCIVSFANVLAMYWSFLSKQKKKYAVFSLVGATPRQLREIIIIHFIILFLISSLAAILFADLSRNLLSRLRLYYSLDIEIVFAVLIFEFMAAFAIAISKLEEIIRQWRPWELGRGNG